MIWSAALFTLVLSAAIVFGALVPAQSVADIRAAAQDAGVWAALAFAGGYALITLTAAPKLALSIAAGVVWGVPLGFVLAYTGAMVGALLAFALSRTLGRGVVARFTGTRFARADALLRQRGLLTMIGTRLVPVIPFTVLNYAAGVTPISTRDYTLGTLIGAVPGTLAYVTVGAFGVTLEWPFFVAMGVLGALTIAGAIFVARDRARQARTSDD